MRFRVVKWMIDKAAEAVPGDCINIFICCHGAVDGEMCIGTNLLTC